MTTCQTVGDAHDESQAILDFIQDCPAIFKSQQIGDPELTKTDKRHIAEGILCNKPVDFLKKFGKFLKNDHLNYFLNKHETSYEVKHYVENIKKSNANERNRTLVKRNRRFEAMKRMEANGDYFSEAEMEKREPFLYHQMVGQYLNDEERLRKKVEASKSTIPTFSNFLLDKMEREEVMELLALQQAEESAKEPEYNTSNVNSTEHHGERGILEQKWGEDWEDVEENFKRKSKISKRQIQFKPNDQEKVHLFEEFKSIMQNNFICGNDSEFNYSDIDSNSDYDCLEIRERDEEEKYFDEESCEFNNTCTDTGIEDY